MSTQPRRDRGRASKAKVALAAAGSKRTLAGSVPLDGARLRSQASPRYHTADAGPSGTPRRPRSGAGSTSRDGHNPVRNADA